jgi:hypothetical protein
VVVAVVIDDTIVDVNVPVSTGRARSGVLRTRRAPAPAGAYTAPGRRRSWRAQCETPAGRPRSPTRPASPVAVQQHDPVPQRRAEVPRKLLT